MPIIALAAVLEFIKALPLLIRTLFEMWTFLKGLAGDNPQAFMLDVAKAFQDLNKAKTPEEKYVVAESLAELIASGKLRKP
jgi:hypothetical protein